LIIKRYLGSEADADKLTTIHPASSYDLKYFRKLAGKADDVLVNFDPNARRGARMAVLREDLNQSCAGSLPRDEPVLDMLAPEVRLKLAPALHMVEAPVSSALAPQDKREIHLPIAALRRYLECPLQGAAQYAFGMADDDGGDEEDVENEP